MITIALAYASPWWPTCNKTCEVVWRLSLHNMTCDDMWSFHWGEEAIGDRTPQLRLNAGWWWVQGSVSGCLRIRHVGDMLWTCETRSCYTAFKMRQSNFWFKPALSKERHAIRSTSPRTPFTIRRRKSGHCKGLWIKPVDMSVGAHEAIRSWARGHEVKGIILAITRACHLPAIHMHPS